MFLCSLSPLSWVLNCGLEKIYKNCYCFVKWSIHSELVGIWVGDLSTFKGLGFLLDTITGSEISGRSRINAFVMLRVFFDRKMCWFFTCTRSFLQVLMLNLVEVAESPSLVHGRCAGFLCMALPMGLQGCCLWMGQSLLLRMGWSQNGEKFVLRWVKQVVSRKSFGKCQQHQEWRRTWQASRVAPKWRRVGDCSQRHVIIRPRRIIILPVMPMLSREEGSVMALPATLWSGPETPVAFGQNLWEKKLWNLFPFFFFFLKSLLEKGRGRESSLPARSRTKEAFVLCLEKWKESGREMLENCKFVCNYGKTGGKLKLLECTPGWLGVKVHTWSIWCLPCACGGVIVLMLSSLWITKKYTRPRKQTPTKKGCPSLQPAFCSILCTF